LFSIRGDSPVNDANQAPESSSLLPKISLVLIIIVGGAVGYLYMQIADTRAEMKQSQEALLDEISKIHETSAVTTQTSRRSVETLKAEVDAARRQASQLAGQAKEDAEKHAEALAANLQKAQQEQAQRVAAVSSEVSQVKETASAATTRIAEVNNDVSNVKTEVASTRSELEKTIANLKQTQGDLGLQSGLIATNGKELAALKQLGERNYVEFKLGKTKGPQRVGDIAVLLKNADPKRNRYTINIVADDKTVEKKNKTVNEPVQFLLSRATQPYELVVNDVKKDLISGYVSSPKVQQPRK